MFLKPKVIYTNITDVLNNVRFKVIVSETYKPVTHPLYLEDGAPEPINTPGPMDENNKCISMVPISYIVDMMVNKIEFSVYHLKDNDIITDYLGAYVAANAGVVSMGHPEAVLFYENARMAYEVFKQKSDRRKAADKTPRKISSVEDILAILNGN